MKNWKRRNPSLKTYDATTVIQSLSSLAFTGKRDELVVDGLRGNHPPVLTIVTGARIIHAEGLIGHAVPLFGRRADPLWSMPLDL